jgi:acetyl-CoA acetyltransferase
MNDLRPTLLLSQLSNMLAGNISIVHGVTGSSRTFLGEAAGIEAIRTAQARVISGQSDIVLVGGAHSGGLGRHRSGGDGPDVGEPEDSADHQLSQAGSGYPARCRAQCLFDGRDRR